MPVAPSLRRRMACWLYEGMLLFGVVFLADYLFSTLTQTRSGLDNRGWQQALIFVVLGWYFVWQWQRTGQTLPMKTWHIQLVDAQTGAPPGAWRAAWRYTLCWIWFLPPLALAGGLQARGGAVALLLIGWVVLWALLSRLHRCGQFAHDALAGTALQSAALPLSSPPSQP
jgi:uncharacterized RDD family membrane protein YckC